MILPKRLKDDCRRGSAALLVLVLAVPLAAAEDKPKDGAAPAAAAKLSYDKQIRPIFQAHCQGCHQPAKAGGDFVMTSFEGLLKGGESGEPAVVAGKPEESPLIEAVTPHDGKAEMPRDKPPLSAVELELISRWISQGAVDDTPKAVSTINADHPPVYTRAPVVPSLAYSPDGGLLAVAGFHEVLLWKADGSELVGRLVGLSERVESLAFSPDGKKLAVSGGVPSRLGEIQVWDVAKRKLVLSVPTTFDTVYGVSWSPDGSKLAYGCADNSVRAIDAKTGAQVLFMGSHDDWVLDTVFSPDGAHLVSVGRDMSAKLTEVATERFIDNMTSITPGALKGGLAAVARHPSREEVVIGGSDGAPKVYRMIRQTNRVIGDDSNLMRELPPLPGRVYGVDVSADGKRIAAASSLEAVSGEIAVYSYEFDPAYPDEIKAIQQKVVTTRSAEENKKLDAYHAAGVKEISRFKVAGAGLYAVAFRPDRGALAAAGGDGRVRLLDPETGKLVKEFVPVPLVDPSQADLVAKTTKEAPPALPEDPTPPEAGLSSGAVVTGLEIEPKAIDLRSPVDYAQLVATAVLDSGERIDVTRQVRFKAEGGLTAVSQNGLAHPLADGRGKLTATLGERTVEVATTVQGVSAPMHPDFVRDVAPVISRLGCNAGTCHGAAKGKNGFKLSLRGYDPLFDVTSLVDDHASRRVSLASPENSMMLDKPTGAAPHGGGQLFQRGDAYYEIIRAWIADGAKLDRGAPKASRIDVFPKDPVVQLPGARQQLRVVATYPDGRTRDVTREAFLESGNTEVATTGRSGLATSLRRGEAPILVRYEGAYASTTLTVMGDRTGFVWRQPPSFGKIDDLVAAKWKRLKIEPSGLCSDAEFLRRAALDLTGLPPTADEVRAFLADSRDSKIKREALVDRLIGSPAYVEYWTNKWADLLQVNRKFLGPEGAAAFRAWIRSQVAADLPYDQFVKAIMTASGSNKEHPAASYFKVLRDPDATMENTTQLFLGVRFNCNKCHDHPFEKWTQDQYYQTAAFFAHVELDPDPASQGRTIGGTSVETPKPLYEKVTDAGKTEVLHDRTKQPTPPKFPYEFPYEKPAAGASRRVELASWLTARENPYFARGYVNRLWGYLFGVGVIEPLDDVRAGNPPSNPELLDYLTDRFVKGGMSARKILKEICASRTYQLSVETNKWNADDKTNYAHAVARRLPAEVLLDAVNQATGSTSAFPGVPAGTRAAALPDSGIELPSGFLNTFGRPARESACECERSSGLQLGPIMALVSGPTLADAIADPSNAVTQLVARESDDAQLIDELFLRILNRPARPEEIEACRADLHLIEEDHARLAEALGRKETEFALKRPQLERERLAAAAAAESELAAYQKELAPKLARMEKERAEATAKLEADLKAYETGFAARVQAWEKDHAKDVVDRWAVVQPKSTTATNGAKLAKEADGSISVDGEQKNGEFVIKADVDLEGVTGVRLEALTDSRLPAKGPGRATDGNFVVTEFQVSAAPKATPDQDKPVALQAALADFSQANFEVARAVDGALDDQRGWAVSPRIGLIHWATFETRQPVGGPGGTTLTFKIHHRFNNSWNLGRFRISVTRQPKPGLSLPEPLRAVLAVAPEVRSAAQTEVLQSYLRGMDAEFAAKTAAVAASKAPLPVDAKLTALRARIEQLKKPVPIDPKLVQLRHDLEMSIQQASTRRLTAAQDVVWALINSPAFLFNH